MISDYSGQKLSQECQCTTEAREIPLCPYWRVENGILLFLINEASTENVAMATKFFTF